VKDVAEVSTEAAWFKTASERVAIPRVSPQEGSNVAFP